MKVEQVFDIVNSVSKQVRGLEDITAVDASSLVSMGNAILSNEKMTDDFFNVLTDRIAMTIENVRIYEQAPPDMLMRTFEYGAIMQKIYIDPVSAQKNTTWGLQDGDNVSPFVITKPVVKQKLFTGLSVWEYDTTIPRRQIQSAFTSPEGVAALINAIMVAIENSLRVDLDATGRLAYANFIAHKINYVKTAGATGKHVVNLLQMYNEESGGALVAREARRDLEFYKFAAYQIMMDVKRMEDMSVLFNTEGYNRHTPSFDARLIMLNDFAKGADVYLQADTYHNEMTRLPNYTTTNFWQGTSTVYDYPSTSKINLEIEGADGTKVTVEQDGIVALLTDVEAVGMMIDDRRLTSMYNPKTETENLFNKANIRYFNDMSENGIVYTVSDTPVTAD